MNFSGLELQVDKPFRVELIGPDGVPLRDRDGKAAYVDIISTDSRKAQALLRAQRETNTQRRLSGMKITSEMTIAEGADNLAQLTTGWYLVAFDGSPLVDDAKQPLTFSIEAARQLYALPSAEWLTEQVRLGSALRTNFMPAPSKT